MKNLTYEAQYIISSYMIVRFETLPVYQNEMQYPSKVNTNDFNLTSAKKIKISYHIVWVER